MQDRKRWARDGHPIGSCMQGQSSLGTCAAEDVRSCSGAPVSCNADRAVAGNEQESGSANRKIPHSALPPTLTNVFTGPLGLHDEQILAKTWRLTRSSQGPSMNGGTGHLMVAWSL